MKTKEQFQRDTPDEVVGQAGKHAYPYWMVWGPSCRPARVRHLTADLAMTEARRLAEKFPGKRFYVLCVIGSEKLPVSEPIALDTQEVRA